MAIERMQKVLIAGMSTDFEKISRRLQALSLLHVEKLQESEKLSHLATKRENEHKLEELASAISFLQRYNAGKRKMLQPMPEYSAEALLNMDDAKAFEAVAESKAIETALNEIRSQIHQKENLLEQLKPYCEFKVPISALKDTQHAVFRLGVLEVKEAASVLQALSEYAEIEQLQTTENGLLPVCIAVHRENAQKLSEQLREAGFADANLPCNGAPGEEIEKTRLQLEQLQQRQAEISEQAQKLADESIHLLQTVYDKYSVRTQRDLLAEKAASVGSKVFLLTGWVKQRDLEQLKEELSMVSADLMVEPIEPEKGEMPPTAVRNSKLLQPFEVVTNMYSLPLYSGIDPNPYMAPFFFLFFGMMLSDAGYGIILTVLCLAFLRIARPRSTTAMITTVLAFGGVSTLIWGALFGGWFGEELLPALWFVPMEEPMTMLIVCLALGLLQISAGILIKIGLDLKAKNIVGAICDEGFILCILWGAVGLLLGVSIGGTIALIGVIGLFLTAGRDRKGILKKFMGGFSAVYGLTSYVSDILSYCRLFGLGLATGVIGMVFNTIATMLMGSPIGFIFAVAILVAGHSFNLGINVLGAFVHSCRLQYIEFYSRFYEGGGRAFCPYTYQTKYTVVTR